VAEGNLPYCRYAQLLGDGRDGARYIATSPAEAIASSHRRNDNRSKAQRLLPALQSSAPPPRLQRMIGRDESIGAVRALIIARFVSIVGAGGMGETTVAVAVADKSLEPVFEVSISPPPLGILPS
jgi:hypothetical protein